MIGAIETQFYADVSGGIALRVPRCAYAGLPAGCAGPAARLRRNEKFQNDPYWRDLILFHEYFHGDNGAGLGASHQTGWTGAVATLIRLFGSIDAKSCLEGDKAAALVRGDEARSARGRSGS